MLYCILFLHQTTTTLMMTWSYASCIASSFYIKPQLTDFETWRDDSCIASSFYIKPQLFPLVRIVGCVVLHPLSTSNHNWTGVKHTNISLYCILFLHQTTTLEVDGNPLLELYCILFLHQTTTSFTSSTRFCGCIASSFYIKPQLNRGRNISITVVLHPLSTSNHNSPYYADHMGLVVLHPLSTSNHNKRFLLRPVEVVVLHPLCIYKNHNAW